MLQPVPNCTENSQNTRLAMLSLKIHNQNQKTYPDKNDNVNIQVAALQMVTVSLIFKTSEKITAWLDDANDCESFSFSFFLF